jgi:hypothetical protein
MLNDTYLGSPSTAATAAGLIGDLRGPNAASHLQDFMVVDGGSTWSAYLVPGTALCPTFYYGQTSTRGLLLVDGVATLAQGVNLWAGFAPLINPPSGSPVNRWADAAADAIVEFILLKYPLYANLQLCAGHSGGGMIANLVAIKLQRRNRNVVPWVHTFGSPRIAGDPLAADLRYTNVVRWMNDTDPVPLLPPRVGDVPALVFTLPINAWIWFARFAHSYGGIELDPNGVEEPAELPSLAVLSPGSSMGAWLVSLEGTAQNTHSIMEYARRLRRLSATLNPPIGPVLRFAPEEEVTSSPTRLVQRQEATFAATVNVIAERQNASPVYVPTIQAFRAFRNGRTWVVAFGDQIIVISGTKRSARACARTMNAAFRRLQHQAVVDPIGFQEQLGEYLAAARDPASGFVPTMNTVIE